MKVKICGLTNEKDAMLAYKYGANFIGVVVSSESKRRVSLEQAKKILNVKNPFVSSVVVTSTTKTQDIEDIINIVEPNFIQLHGDIHPELLRDIEFSGKFIKTIPMYEGVDYGQYFKYYDDMVTAYLLDTRKGMQLGGTGTTHNWDLSARIVKESKKQVFLAGGLTPGNVYEAIKIVNPYCVDVASGVEESPGKKSEDKIKRFIEATRL